MSVKTDVINFFIKKIKFPYKEIDEEFILNKEYWSEDEVIDLLLDFFETFNVKSNEFNILEYFIEEPQGFDWEKSFNIKNLLKQDKGPIEMGKKKLMIKDFIEAAGKKEWINK